VHNKAVSIEQQNNYPWEGNLKFIVSPKSPEAFTLMVRIPGWVQNKVLPSDLYSFVKDSKENVGIKLNGQAVTYTTENGYAVLNRKWKKGDIVEISLPMEVKLVQANENLKDDNGKLAVERGPLVYCAEWKDNAGKASNIMMPANASFTSVWEKDLLNGVELVKTNVPVIEMGADEMSISTANRQVTLIPYFAWANRGEGEMIIWFPSKVRDIDLIATAGGGK
jgi:DUF1680 family protein